MCVCFPALLFTVNYETEIKKTLNGFWKSKYDPQPICPILLHVTNLPDGSTELP